MYNCPLNSMGARGAPHTVNNLSVTLPPQTNKLFLGSHGDWFQDPP